MYCRGYNASELFMKYKEIIKNKRLTDFDETKDFIIYTSQIKKLIKKETKPKDTSKQLKFYNY